MWNWAQDGWIVAVGLMSACSCALLGNYLVLRRLSLMGDAISHAVLPGLAVAFLIAESRDTWVMFVGAVVAGVLTALLTQVITDHGKIEHGAAMGVVFSVLFALGLVLIRRAADHIDLDPSCVLFGNIDHIPLDAYGAPPSWFLSQLGWEVSVPPAAARLAVVLAANLIFVLIFYKELKITSFDPELATTLGIRSSVMHYALMIMVAVTTVANFEAVGSILVIAMFIVPSVAAHLLTDRMGVMVVLSVLLAAVSALGGSLLATLGPGLLGSSLTLNTAGMMTVAAGALLLMAIVGSPEHGVMARVFRRAALASRIVRQDILGLAYRWREAPPTGDRSMPQIVVNEAIGGGWRVRSAMRRLRRMGLIRTVPDRDGTPAIALTEAGLREASSLIGAHRLWETFLATHFPLDPDHLHDPAERMEHYITPHLRSALREELEEPTADPQGKRIPRDKE